MAAPVAIWTVDPLADSAVGLDDLKAHLQVDHTEEDAVIAGIGIAATAIVEQRTQRVLVQRGAVLLRSRLPCGAAPIILPGGHVSQVASVVIDGAALPGCVVIGRSPARLVPPADWPVFSVEGYPVTVSYTVGDTGVPADLLIAIKMIAADLYDRRSGGGADPDQNVPMAAVALMSPHRILSVM